LKAKDNRVKSNVRMFNRALLVLVLVALLAIPGSAQENQEPDNAVKPSPVLAEAVMCEDIEAYAPLNRAVVFSTAIGQVVCFTAFEQVPAKMYIFHNWFRSDKLITSKRLTLNPPSWSSFSRVQLRQADVGPWRVEILDEQGKLMKTLRFSITD
jgi:hypothetical protein